jgi:hypothetical protein
VLRRRCGTLDALVGFNTGLDYHATKPTILGDLYGLVEEELLLLMYSILVPVGVTLAVGPEGLVT